MIYQQGAYGSSMGCQLILAKRSGVISVNFFLRGRGRVRALLSLNRHLPPFHGSLHLCTLHHYSP